jgi:hypothetical protein
MTLLRIRIISCAAAAFVCSQFLWTPVSAGEADGFHWVDDPDAGTADLRFGDEPVLRYMYAFDTSTKERRFDTGKVFHHVFGPGTGKLITKGSGGLYPHHRGLFVGWNKTLVDGKRYDFWHCKEGVIHQRHSSFVQIVGGAKQGTMTAEIAWNDSAGKPVITETRTVTASRLPGDDPNSTGWQIDWQTTLQSNRGKITLDGDRQHAGFQFRAAQAVAESKGARYLRPQGFPDDPAAYQVNDRKDPDQHLNLGWLAMTYELDGQHYTIEYFEDPSLPQPSRYSERPYGRFGAFFKTQLSPEKPLAMKYRVIVTSGPTPSRETIQKRYKTFVKELAADG